MAQMHESMQRLYVAAAELTPPINGQSDLARAIDETPQTVNNWESRGISQRAANKAQMILGINATWLLSGSGPKFVGELGSSPPSQSALLDLDTLDAGLKLVKAVCRITRQPLEQAMNALSVSVAMEIVCEAEEAMDDNNVLDFMARFAERLEERKGDGDKRQADRRASS